MPRPNLSDRTCVSLGEISVMLFQNRFTAFSHHWSGTSCTMQHNSPFGNVYKRLVKVHHVRSFFSHHSKMSRDTVDPRLLDRREQVPASDAEPSFLPIDIDYPQSLFANLHDESLFRMDAGAIQDGPSAA